MKLRPKVLSVGSLEGTGSVGQVPNQRTSKGVRADLISDSERSI